MENKIESTKDKMQYVQQMCNKYLPIATRRAQKFNLLEKGYTQNDLYNDMFLYFSKVNNLEKKSNKLIYFELNKLLWAISYNQGKLVYKNYSHSVRIRKMTQPKNILSLDKPIRTSEEEKIPMIDLIPCKSKDNSIDYKNYLSHIVNKVLASGQINDSKVLSKENYIKVLEAINLYANDKIEYSELKPFLNKNVKMRLQQAVKKMFNNMQELEYIVKERTIR